jgi:predicted Fe-Mo cluster-binding NifX family protein
MRLAVTATGKDLEAKIDSRFGRAAYFVVVDPETMAYETVNNSQSLDLPQGAGIQAGQTIVKSQVDVLITGNCGPKAFQVLQNAGVKIFTGASGSVKDAIMQYKNGELKQAQNPNVEGHWV